MATIAVIGDDAARAQDLVASKQIQGDYMIKPDTTGAKLSTDQWPLLLKNYDQLLVRSSHFTPIPHGCSPLKRDLSSYIKSGVINLDKPSNPRLTRLWPGFGACCEWKRLATRVHWTQR
ncbi:hypothetical protein L7F22_023177 [Adiantum nelumboides]|nr:hypothetical protein [Adiantum nelumboides]